MACSDVAQGTNLNARIQIEYKEPSGAPRHIFAKLPPDGKAQRSLVLGSGMGRREILFYRELTTDEDHRSDQRLAETMNA